MSQLVPMLCAVGMIMGSLGMTGVAHAFPSELVRLAGGSLPMMLILGALSSFILGMGMTAIAVYVFLAVIMAPAMTEIGLNPLAVHLFLLYWGLLSFITPPVCIAVYPAATIAGASSMRSGFAAMRLGLTAFVIPFFFVLDPALILHGTAQQIFVAVAGAFMGVFLLASALEGYMIGIGRLGYTGHSHSYAGRYSGFFVRGVLFSAGFLLALPGAYSDAAGAVLVACFIFAHMALKRKSRRHGLSTLDQNTLTSADPMDSSNVNV